MSKRWKKIQSQRYIIWLGFVWSNVLFFPTFCTPKQKTITKKPEGAMNMPSPTPTETITPAPENMTDFCKIDPDYCRAAQDKFETYRQNARNKARDIKDGIVVIHRFIQSKPEVESSEQKETLKILDGLAS